MEEEVDTHCQEVLNGTVAMKILSLFLVLGCFVLPLQNAIGADPLTPGQLVQVVEKNNKSRIGELLSDTEGQIEILELKTGKKASFTKDDLKKVSPNYSVDAAVLVVGLPSVVAWKISKGVKKDAPSGKVAKLDGAIIYVSLGKTQGIAVGDVLRVYRGEEVLKDPTSGEILGKQRRRISDLKVTEVQEKFCKSKQEGELEIALAEGDQVEPAKFNNAIAVLPFTSLDGDDGSGVALSEQLTTVLVQRDIPVVERTLLSKALAELAIQQSELFDPTHAKDIGRQVGAGAILTGTIRTAGQLNEVNLRLVDVETGKIKFSFSVKLKELPSGSATGSGEGNISSSSALAGKWISKGATYSVSSRYEGIKPLDSLLSGEQEFYSSPGGVSGSAKGKDGFFAFTTNNGAGESITIDLGKASVIEGIQITNNSETAAAAARAKDLTVWISKEAGNRGTQVWLAKKGEREFKIALPKGVPGRYVTIGFPEDKREYLHLKVVKILGR